MAAIYRENILSRFPQIHQRTSPSISLGTTKGHNNAQEGKMAGKSH